MVGSAPKWEGNALAICQDNTWEQALRGREAVRGCFLHDVAHVHRFGSDPGCLQRRPRVFQGAIRIINGFATGKSQVIVEVGEHQCVAEPNVY